MSMHPQIDIDREIFSKPLEYYMHDTTCTNCGAQKWHKISRGIKVKDFKIPKEICKNCGVKT